MKPGASGIAALRDYLLGPTLDHAVRGSPFWRRRLGTRAARVSRVDELPSLPLTTRRELAEAGPRLYTTAPDELDQVVLSSGTSREGRLRLLVRRNQAELAAQQDYLVALGAGRQRPERVLHLHNVQHGLPAGAPALGETRIPWMPHPNMLELAFHHLADGVRAKAPFRVMRGSVSALLTLAVAAKQRSRDARRFGLRYLGTNSYGVSPRVERLLTRAFGAVVVDNYSLSELPSFASRCARCGALHWEHPPVVPELVDLHTARSVPLEPGATGELVLTGLYPYVAQTPLIRYATGDVLRVTGWCEARGDFGWRFLGRKKDTVSVQRRGARLDVHAEPLYHLLDSAPGIARTRHPVELLGVIEPGELGFPKYRLRTRGSMLWLQVEPLGRASQARLRTFLERRLRSLEGVDEWPLHLEFTSLPDVRFKP